MFANMIKLTNRKSIVDKKEKKRKQNCMDSNESQTAWDWELLFRIIKFI